MEKMKMITNQQLKVNVHGKVFCKFLIFIAGFIFSSFLTVSVSYAQLKISRIQNTPDKIVKGNIGGRTQSIEPLKLPFFDDFSILSLDSLGHADSKPISLWVNSDGVWINEGMAIDPPSIYVATFDGLNSSNLPYDASKVLSEGFTDTLTSRVIDLDLIPGQDTSVFLSFFYQWQGNGEPPDLSDYLQLDFKKDSVWQTVLTIKPTDPDPTVFNYVMQKVKPEFLNKDFQFRFLRYGRQSGPYDTWNLDYVYLDSNRHKTSIKTIDSKFEDITIGSKISALFKPYNAVPLQHFLKVKHFDNAVFDVQNLGGDRVADYKSTATLKNYKNDKTSYSDTLTLTPRSPISGGTMPAFERAKVVLDVFPDPNDTLQFNPLSKKIEIKIKVEAIAATSLPFPVDFSMNDTLSTMYTLYDYYAYDDGVAEFTAEVAKAGNSAACLYELITSEPDTLTAIDIYLPDYSISTNLALELNLYDDLNGKPNNILRRITSTSLKRSGLNNFTRLLIPTPIIIKDKFYIGWTDAGAGTIKVGLDFSNDNGDKFFSNAGSGWDPVTDIQGSLMIRPVFGKTDEDLTTGLPYYEKNLSVIYPNPNSGSFIIPGHYDQLRIVNVMGQSISFQQERLGNDTSITLQSPSAGLYIIQLQIDKAIQTQKVIVK